VLYRVHGNKDHGNPGGPAGLRRDGSVPGLQGLLHDSHGDERYWTGFPRECSSTGLYDAPALILLIRNVYHYELTAGL